MTETVEFYENEEPKKIGVWSWIMKKINNKGFAISTILYGLLALLIIILMLIFQIMRTNNNNSKELSQSIKI